MHRRIQPTHAHAQDAQFAGQGMAVPQSPPPTGNVSWKNPVSGDWTNAADWTGGAVPGASNDVTISVAGNYTVTISTGDAAHSLTVGNAGTSIADNAGALALTTKLSLNAGTFALSNGGGVSGGTFSVAAGALVTDTGASTISSAIADLGSVSVASGVLELDGGGSLGGTLSGAGTLGLGAGAFTTTGLAGNGNLAIYTNASLTALKPGGTLTASVTVSQGGTLAAASGANLTLAGGLSVGNAAGFNGTGYLAGPGTFTTTGTSLIYDGAGNLTLWLGGGVNWVNGGTVTDTGISYLNFTTGDAVSITNNAGANFNLASDSAQFQLPYTGTDRFTNAGTLAKTGGTGVSAMALTIANTGLINVVSGTLELDAGGALGGSLAGAGTLGLGGGTFTTSGMSGGGNLAIYDNASLTGTVASATIAGPAEIYGGGTLAAAAHDQLTLAAGVAAGNQAGFVGTGYMGGPGTLTTGGASFIYDGQGNVTLWLGGGVNWVNGGTVTDTAITYLNFTTGDAASIVNNAGANFDLASDSAQFQLPYTGTDLFTNAGTLAKTGGTGVSQMAFTIANTGLINVVSGTLELDAGGALGGALAGAGTLGLGGGTFTTSGMSGGGTLAIYDNASLTGTAASASIAGLTEIYGGGTLAAATHDQVTLAAGLSAGTAAGFAGTGFLEGPGTITTTGASSLYDGGGNVTLWLGDGVNWVNNGTVTDTAIAYLNITTGDAVSIVNNAGAVFDLASDSAQFQLPYTGTDSFANAGTLAKTGGTGTSSVAIALTNTSTGTVSAASGTMQFLSTVTNAGLMVATGGGTLDLSQAVFTNLPGTTLAGGAYEADANSIIELATNATIVTDNAAITLSGAGSAIQSYNTTTGVQTGLESSLATIGAAGALTLLAGRNFASTVNSIGVNGRLSLGGVTFTVKNLTVGAGGTATGSGRIAAAISDTGAISAAGGTLVLAGAVTGTGALQAAAAATLDLTKGGALTEAISGAGTLELSGTTAYTLAGATIATAAVAVDAGATLSARGAITGSVADAGTLTATGGTLTVGGAVTGAGVLTASAGATLDLTGGGNFTGAISGAGTLQLDGATPMVVQDAGLSVATVKVDGGATLELTGGGSIGGSLSGAGTLQLDGSASYALAGVTLAMADVAVSAGATLSGTGVLAGAVLDNGAVAASGGTLTVNGAVTGAGALQAGAGAVLDLTAGGLFAGAVTGAGTLRLDGATAFVLQTGGSLGIASVVVDAGATLDLNGGASLGGSITGAGTLQLDSGAYTLGGATVGAGALLLDAGASLSGPGTIRGALTNNGTLSTSSGTLLVSGAVAGSGVYSVGAGATLDLAGGGSVALASGAGTLRFDGTSGFTIADAGTIQVTAVAVGAGGTVSTTGTLTGSLADAGTVTAASGTLSLKGAISGGGTLAASAGTVLDILGGGVFAGSLAGGGAIRIDSALTLNSGASLGAASVAETANVTLGAGESLTNLAADSYSMSSVTKQTDTLTGAKGDVFTNAGSFTASGTGTESVGLGFINSGTVSVGSSTLSFIGAVTNNGIIDAAGGTVMFKTAVAGSGTIRIDNGGTVSLLKGSAAGQHVDFLAGGGLLDLTKASTFKGMIQDFAAGDRIDLIKGAETSYSFANGVLTVKDNAKTVASLHFAGTYTMADFTLTSDGHGGTFITHS